MKSMIKIIQEYDKQVAKEVKVNKALFALKHGLTKSVRQSKTLCLKKSLTCLNKYKNTIIFFMYSVKC